MIYEMAERNLPGLSEKGKVDLVVALAAVDSFLEGPEHLQQQPLNRSSVLVKFA